MLDFKSISIVLAISAFCAGSGITPTASAQQTNDSLAEMAHSFADKEVQRYTFSDSTGEDRFERVPQSLLRWSNAVSNPAFGDTYIWTERGCAKVIISLFTIGEPRYTIAAECQSLSQAPFQMRREGNLVWRPSTAGIEFKTLEAVRAPANSPRGRMVQMNSIARRFRAEFSPHTRPDEFTQLRMLTKPLYRYQSKNDDVVDGAVYGFVNSTDPEFLLVIEARKIDGKNVWVYAPARSRHDPIRVYLRDQLVWDVPRLSPPWHNIRDPSKPYFNLRLEELVDNSWLRPAKR